MPQTGRFFLFKVHDIRNSVLLLSLVFQPALQRFMGGLATNNLYAAFHGRPGNKQLVMLQALLKPQNFPLMHGRPFSLRACMTLAA
jgi:hypothetical protein